MAKTHAESSTCKLLEESLQKLREQGLHPESSDLICKCACQMKLVMQTLNHEHDVPIHVSCVMLTSLPFEILSRLCVFQRNNLSLWIKYFEMPKECTKLKKHLNHISCYQSDLRVEYLYEFNFDISVLL